MDRGVRWATACRVAQSQTQLKQLSTHTLLAYFGVSVVPQMVKNLPQWEIHMRSPGQ